MKLKTRQCEECQFFQWHRPVCTVGHLPRWYDPKSPVDETYGFKRACEHYKPKESE